MEKGENRYAYLDPDSYFHPDNQERRLRDLIGKVERETNRERKTSAAIALAEHVTRDRYDCVGVARAISVGAEIYSSAKGSKRDAGAAVIEEINKFIESNLTTSRVLQDDSMDTVGELQRGLEPVNRRNAQLIRNPQVSPLFSKHRSVALFCQTVADQTDGAIKEGAVSLGIVPMISERFMRAQSPEDRVFGGLLNRGHRSSEEYSRLTGIQQELFSLWTTKFTELNEITRIQYPQKTIDILSKYPDLLHGTYPGLYTREHNGVSLKDLDEQWDIQEFNRQALAFIAGSPQGDLFWNDTIDLLFFNCPKLPKEKMIAGKKIGDSTFNLKVQSFNSWLTVNMLGPALGLRETDPDFDALMSSAAKNCLSRVFLDSLSDTIFGNYIGFNGLNTVNFEGSNFDVSKYPVGNLVPIRIEEFHQNPNGIFTEFREVIIPQLQKSLGERFPGEPWAAELVKAFSSKTPPVKIAANAGERIKETVPLAQVNTAKASEALNNFYWNRLKKAVDQNTDKIKEVTQGKQCEVEQDALRGTGFKGASFFINNDGTSEDGINFAYIVGADTPWAYYEAYGKLDLESGKISEIDLSESLKNDNDLLLSVQRQSLFLFYYFLRQTHLIGPDFVLDFSLNSTGISVEIKEPSEDDLFARMELESTMILLEEGKINAKYFEDSEQFKQLIKKYPGGLKVLQEKVADFLPAEVPPEENLIDMLNYLEGLKDSE